MSRNILLVLAVVCFGGSSASAQNPAGQLASTPKGDPTLLVVTGCLEKGPDANTFLLTKVPDPTLDSVRVAAGATVPTVTYQLSGGQNLMAHVGHKVEVSGKGPLKAGAPVKLTDTKSKNETVSGDTTAKTEVKEKAAIAIRPLAVESVRMISSDCSAK